MCLIDVYSHGERCAAIGPVAPHRFVHHLLDEMDTESPGLDIVQFTRSDGFKRDLLPIVFKGDQERSPRRSGLPGAVQADAPAFHVVGVADDIGRCFVYGQTDLVGPGSFDPRSFTPRGQGGTDDSQQVGPGVEFEDEVGGGGGLGH